MHERREETVGDGVRGRESIGERVGVEEGIVTDGVISVGDAGCCDGNWRVSNLSSSSCRSRRR